MRGEAPIYMHSASSSPSSGTSSHSFPIPPPATHPLPSTSWPARQKSATTPRETKALRRGEHGAKPSRSKHVEDHCMIQPAGAAPKKAQPAFDKREQGG